MSFKSRNRLSVGSLAKVISWNKGSREIRKVKEVKGDEKNAGYMRSFVRSVLPLGFVGLVLAGTCVYRGQLQQDKFEEWAGGVEEVEASRPIGIATVREMMETPEAITPDDIIPIENFSGKYPQGKPKLPTITPTIPAPTSTPIKNLLYDGKGKYSYYWPPLGGVNCEEPCAIMASGMKWEDNLNYAVACPAEFPMYSRVVLPFGEFRCLDRGSMIIMINGVPWIDHLSEVPHFNYGFLMDVKIYEP